jgi:hypothetical protein
MSQRGMMELVTPSSVELTNLVKTLVLATQNSSPFALDLLENGHHLTLEKGLEKVRSLVPSLWYFGK